MGSFFLPLGIIDDEMFVLDPMPAVSGMITGLDRRAEGEKGQALKEDQNNVGDER